MKTTVIAATIALGLTAGVALADQPMVLTNAQLDRVTGGALAEYGLILRILAIDKEVSVDFTAAEQVDQSKEKAPLQLPGHTFHLKKNEKVLIIVPPGGVGVKP